jgi:hypothetical protein
LRGARARVHEALARRPCRCGGGDNIVYHSKMKSFDVRGALKGMFNILVAYTRR